MHFAQAREHVECLKSGHPIASLDMLSVFDREFVRKLMGMATRLDDPRGQQRTAWVSGWRGYGKTQALLTLREEMVRNAHDQRAKVLIVHVNGLDMENERFEDLLIKNYFCDRKSMQVDNPYAFLLDKVNSIQESVETYTLRLFELCIELLGTGLPGARIFARLASGIMSSHPLLTPFLVWRLKLQLKDLRDAHSGRMYNSEEIEFLSQWAFFIFRPTQRMERRFRRFLSEQGEGMRRILFGLIRKSGITSVIVLLDEADYFANDVSPARVYFEKHFDSFRDDSHGLNFFYLFFCLPRTIRVLNAKINEWGFVRRYMDPAPGHEVMTELKGARLQNVMLHIRALCGLWAVAYGQHIDLNTNDVDIVVRTLRGRENKHGAGGISWSAYWKTLIAAVEYKARSDPKTH